MFLKIQPNQIRKSTRPLTLCPQEISIISRMILPMITNLALKYSIVKFIKRV